MCFWGELLLDAVFREIQEQLDAALTKPTLRRNQHCTRPSTSNNERLALESPPCRCRHGADFDPAIFDSHPLSDTRAESQEREREG